MTISTVLPLPTKDFKAVIENGKVTKVGVEFLITLMLLNPLQVELEGLGNLAG